MAHLSASAPAATRIHIGAPPTSALFSRVALSAGAKRGGASPVSLSTRRAVAATADDAVQASCGQEQGKVSGEKVEGQRLYIGNIPWSLDAHEATAAVQALCADAGVAVTSVTVPWLDKKRKKLQKHRGYAFVQLPGEADAADCVAGLAGAALEGAELKVNVATPPPPPRPVIPKPQGRQHVKLYVGSLPVELTSQELREQFKSCGSVVDCKVVCDDDGVSRGFAFITMGTPSAAEHALNLSGSFMDGRYRGEGGIVLDQTERRSIVVNTQTNSGWEVVSEQDDEDASDHF